MVCHAFSISFVLSSWPTLHISSFFLSFSSLFSPISNFTPHFLTHLILKPPAASFSLKRPSFLKLPTDDTNHILRPQPRISLSIPSVLGSYTFGNRSRRHTINRSEMGLFTKINKPLLAGHYENEDVQISAELCPNITINVVGLAKVGLLINAPIASHALHLLFPFTSFSAPLWSVPLGCTCPSVRWF